ncbi:MULTISPECIES: gamma-glutamylcyclotransferase family protein [Methylomicrobium]|uniref:Gamma-glutamylcyclotransferase AIG2-like domain-containing protein n=1 Tax=Methylomicrobium album BG8 TaxID=686340 RepID=H8GMR4_METAL|nr:MULTISPECIES: gamma-glutamylcyclotransferase family protein [Methylomicrobium]EIC29466.1 hypothetical protein Metal_1696 [Methylomicrobium album BG8]
MINDLLFVYGTLRRGSRHPLARLLAENAEWLGFAYFSGRLFDLGAYPGAVPSGDPAHRVRGELYRLDDPAAILPLLDRYEEFGEEFPEPNEFIRSLQAVRFKGCALKAWIYLYNWPTGNLTVPGQNHSHKLK